MNKQVDENEGVKIDEDDKSILIVLTQWNTGI